MLLRLTDLKNKYPPQFWLLFWGYMISTIGASISPRPGVLGLLADLSDFGESRTWHV